MVGLLAGWHAAGGGCLGFSELYLQHRCLLLPLLAELCKQSVPHRCSAFTCAESLLPPHSSPHWGGVGYRLADCSLGSLGRQGTA